MEFASLLGLQGGQVWEVDESLLNEILEVKRRECFGWLAILVAEDKTTHQKK